mmetsp:Transcript_20902/g.54312  ORF Transcript_20902/g.54312 Transcript_20902/m.54312 type:complete len:286 (+) Transcript_20902:139-996(+)
MDRAADFVSLREMIRARGTRVRQHSTVEKAPRDNKVPGFTELTKRVAADISVTSLKLEKLQICCTEHDMGLRDYTTEIGNLTLIVKQDISALNRALNKVRELVNERVTRTQNNHYLMHINNITTSLQRQLGTVSEPFKTLLEVRSARIKAEAQRAAALEAAHVGPAAEMRSRRPPAAAAEAGKDTVVLMVDAEVQKRKERDEQTSAIEQTISQLDSIFSQLAQLVHDQGAQLERIDGDIMSTQHNVEAAHSEVTKYLQSLTTNRMLIIKTFIALIALFALFMLFK